MINGIASSGNGRVELARPDTARRDVSAVPGAAVAGASTAIDRLSSPAAALAATGAPIDSDKVAAIRAAIANGSYAINPRAIAEKMIALDLPVRG